MGTYIEELASLLKVGSSVSTLSRLTVDIILADFEEL